MSEMFSFCSSLQSLDLSKFNTEKLNYINSMFQNCSSLTFLDLSNFNISKCYNPNKVFNGLMKECDIITKDKKLLSLKKSNCINK